MADFPTALDSFSNPTGSDTLDSPDHAGQHSDANDAIEAVEEKLGTTASTPVADTLLAGTGTGTSEWLSHASADVEKASDAATHAGNANAHHNRSHDHSSSSDGNALAPATLTIPAAASPAQTAEGSAVWDSDDDVLTVGDGAARKTFGYLGTTVGAAIGTAAAGTSKEAANIGHVHPTGAGTPSTQAIGDAASTGSGPAAANTDHKHAITNPLTTQYDLWMGGASGAPGRLAKGSNYQKLEVNGSGAVGYVSRSGFEGTASGQSITNGSDDPIEWTEVTDTDAFHSGTSSAIVIPSGMGGWYQISATVEFSSGGTTRYIKIKKGGATLAYGQDGNTGFRRTTSWIGKLAAGDSITIEVLASAAGITVDAQVGLVFLGL